MNHQTFWDLCGNDPVAAKKDVNFNRFPGDFSHASRIKFFLKNYCLLFFLPDSLTAHERKRGIHRSFLCLAKIGLAHVPLPEDAAGEVLGYESKLCRSWFTFFSNTLGPKKMRTFNIGVNSQCDP